MIAKVDDNSINLDNKYVVKFKSAMDDDFNTPLALSVLFELIHEINIGKDINLAMVLCYLANILGILKQTPEYFLQLSSGANTDTEQIEQLIKERNLAKQAKNYQLADQIRDKLKEIGVLIEDTPEGTNWRLS
jgi:cysteinyl-tRNA synthetase